MEMLGLTNMTIFTRKTKLYTSSFSSKKVTNLFVYVCVCVCVCVCMRLCTYLGASMYSYEYIFDVFLCLLFYYITLYRHLNVHLSVQHMYVWHWSSQGENANFVENKLKNGLVSVKMVVVLSYSDRLPYIAYTKKHNSSGVYLDCKYNANGMYHWGDDLRVPSSNHWLYLEVRIFMPTTA